MKHIKRKFLAVEPKTPIETWDKLELKERKDVYKLGKVPKDKILGMRLEDGTFVATFRYQKSKKEFYFIPEPEPALMYFNNAQIHLALVEQSKQELLEVCGKFENGVDMSHKLYNFMYNSSSVVIFLFTAVEATINKLIPADIIYTTKEGERLDIEKVQRLPFSEKIMKILPVVTGKDFVKTHKQKYKSILKIKGYRDEIIHTKKKAEVTSYASIAKVGLELNYPFVILEVRDFINYYFPGLVVECDCGKDF